MEDKPNYSEPPRKKEEYENLSDYYEHFYHYLKRVGDKKWLRLRIQLKDSKKESIDELVEFSNTLYVFQLDSEKDPEIYWRNAFVKECESGIRRIKDILTKLSEK